MKTLLVLLMILNHHAFGAVSWTHSVVEGEDGGINANYFFYEAFKPDCGDGTIMSVQRVRAIYARNRKGDIVVIDYFLQDGIRVVAMRAPKKALADLIACKDVDLTKISEFSVAAETCVGYLTPKNPQALSGEQRERIFNLVHILSMQRSPIKSGQSGAGQPATRPEVRSAN